MPHLFSGTVAETKQLRLRYLTHADAPFIVKLLNSPGWLKYIGDRNVHSLDDARNYLQNGPMKSYADHGFGLYLVELKSNGMPAGMCGLLKRDNLDHPDIGFAFLPEYAQQGYGFEGATAVLAHAQALGITTLLAIVTPGNIASIGLLQKLGMKKLGTVDMNGEALEKYGWGRQLES